MAGRGGKQNTLQTEIKTQEEWDALMKRQGLTVIDVYASWCGPCKAIISLFRKIRNDQQDEVLAFATACTDTIDSLTDYRGKCQPTFLFYGDGHLVQAVRGCDGPMITKLIHSLTEKERQIAKGAVGRDTFIDKVVSKEPEPEEKQDAPEEERDEGEEELAKDMTRRKSAGSVLKIETMSKHVTIAVLKPDVVQAGLVEQISEAILGAGYEIVKTVERLLTSEEVTEVCRHDMGDGFDQIIELMTSGPCVALAVSKAGDVTGEDVVSEFMTLVGPHDINTAKEEAPESLRAKFATDSRQNAINCSTSMEDVTRDLEFFFPELKKPTFDHEVVQKTLQRTIAIIRPNAVAEKESIIKTIEDNGFVIAMQKVMEFSREKAEELYSRHKDEDSYEHLIANMTSGPSVVLCLAKSNAVEVWKEMLVPKEIKSQADGEEESPDRDVSLQVKFATPEDTCEPLHASNSIAQFEREMNILFPFENVIVVIQPDNVADESARNIISRLKHEGFNVLIEREMTMTSEQASFLYKKEVDEEHFEKVIAYMSSGQSLFLLLSCEDAIYRLSTLLGPANPGKAKELNPDSIRAQYGADVVRNAVYGGSDKQDIMDIIKNFFPNDTELENALAVGSRSGDVGNKTQSVDASETSEHGETTDTSQSQPDDENNVGETNKAAAVDGGNAAPESNEPSEKTDIENGNSTEVDGGGVADNIGVTSDLASNEQVSAPDGEISAPGETNIQE